MSDDLISGKFLLGCAEYDNNGRLIIPYRYVKSAPTAFDKEKVIEEIKDKSRAERLEDVSICGNVYGYNIEIVINKEDVIEIIEKGGLN